MNAALWALGALFLVIVVAAVVTVRVANAKGEDAVGYGLIFVAEVLAAIAVLAAWVFVLAAKVGQGGRQ